MTRPRFRILGGVCAGFAEHTGLPVTLVRTSALLLAVCGGAGILLYAWLWAATPSASGVRERVPAAVLTAPAQDAAAGAPRSTGSATEPGPAAPEPHAADDPEASARAASRLPITEILLGLALLAAGVALVANQLGAQLPLESVIPAIVVIAGAGLAWSQLAALRGAPSGDSARFPGGSGLAVSRTLLVRTLGALVLVALGILLFFVMGDEPNAWTVVVAAVAVLIGVGIVVAPWIVRLVRDLGEERAARARESERADIAAHLHDSVLQTLALIQQKAGPGSDAARLARAQERELRDWLFTGEAREGGDLGAELRRIAVEIEHDHAVRFEVVTTGVDAPAPEPFVAAAREAMLNAARHAGGDVSVYLERSSTQTELIVTDRGPGFELDAIPERRLGVRESIIGRMSRAGGEASLGPGPGGTGTRVILRLPNEEANGHAG
ncbi:ATP-binding protein [Compostimonas suwonensis]|nr:ATP-binding protein [Compostimonas suwonensis]